MNSTKRKIDNNFSLTARIEFHREKKRQYSKGTKVRLLYKLANKNICCKIEYLWQALFAQFLKI
jgi:hypothetical protein